MNVTRIKETCLYVKDLQRTRKFYTRVMGLPEINFSEGRHVFFRAGESVLLCFNPEATKKEKELPPHFASGRMHLAFEVPGEEYDDWKARLKNENIEILHEQIWKENKRSLYFYDPDFHVIELIEPGIWE